MLKVLINAYTCCPNMGSEQGMGWNFITYLAKHCEVFVISEGEYRATIEEWIASEKLKVKSEELTFDDPRTFANRMHFYWNPVPQSTREKCWNQGNWSFYPLYKKWQERTAEIAREICREERIDVLHQLNMIGFREPGCLAKVSKETGIPLVWGPIGGLKKFPMAYASGVKMKAFNWLKNAITEWQIRYDKRVVETLHQASVLVSSIPDSYNAIKRCHGLESVIIPETGCFISDCSTEFTKIADIDKAYDNFSTKIPHSSSLYPKPLTLMWVGKFDYRKRLDIALKAVATAGNPNILLKVFGTGNENQVAEAKHMAQILGIENRVQFMGSQPNDVVKAEMRKADAFLFTSVNEDTSTVVLEAVSNQLPVICFDCCGMAAVIDEMVGVKVPLTNPDQSVKDIADVLDDLYKHREKLTTMSHNCIVRAQELSWENKAKKMVELYEEAMRKGSECELKFCVCERMA